MNSSRSGDVSSRKAGAVSPIAKKKFQIPPLLFQHGDVVEGFERSRKVDQGTVTNMVNHTHFTERCIFVHMRHRRYEQTILLRAYPEWCLGSELTCRWSKENLSNLKLVNYEFLYLMIDDGRSIIMIPAVLKEMNEDSLAVVLPRRSYAVGARTAKRYACKEIIADCIQSGFFARGELLDFSPVGLRVRVRPEQSSSFHWFNSEELVTVNLRGDQHIFFSGDCRCIRQQGETEDREIVLAPVAKRINRFKRKQIRSLRQKLVPLPSLIFDHPFLKKKIQMEVYDISTSGFSVYENGDECVLMQGMIIPDLTIIFAGAFRITCTAQVIYRNEEEDDGIRCGVAILDMDIDSYTRLAHILTSAMDPHAYISSAVDMEALWEFLFDAGFLYPRKYRLIQSYKKDFKETYRKLYKERQEIAGYLTYQKNGQIYGHISMVRAYQRAWMIHHHAARAMDKKQTGFVVLKQIMYYLSDMHRLPSANMDYVMCYFRRENRFPDRVFGGFARALNNAKGCSMDLFSYLPYTRLSLGGELPKGWSSQECSAFELWELRRFYGHYSGGLLIDALGLDKECSGDESLGDIYDRLGLMRKSKAYSLTYEGALTAVLIVDRSDLGFNLSELLNGIKVLVTNPEGLPWNVLSTAISQLTGVFHMEKVPILFYPFDYTKANHIPSEKQYQLWILNVDYGNEYLEYMQRNFGIV